MPDPPTIEVKDSILASTKKVLGIADDYIVFDLDVMTHINSVFDTLTQIGVGPPLGFVITGRDNTWTEFFDGFPLLNSVKSYVYLRVRLLFDPPPTSFAISAQQEQVKELESRLNMSVDNELPVLVVVDPDLCYE